MTEFNRKFTQDAEKAGRQAYRRVQTDAVKAQDEHAKGVYLHWVGPSSVERIMKDFMRIDEDILGQLPRQVKFDLPLRKGTNKLERHLYDAFAETVIRFGISPNLSFLIGANGTLKIVGGSTETPFRPDDAHRRSSNNTVRKHCGDTATQRVSNNDSSAVRRLAKEPKTNKPPVLPREPFDWTAGDLIVEFQKSSLMDPFYTEFELKRMGATLRGANAEQVPFAKIDYKSRRILGQLAIYAKEIFDHQHRTHLFQLLVCGRHARLIVWDRSGAIVSESFDYIEHPQLMAEFFWRYNHMTEAARGNDSTAVLATSHEEELFTTKVEQFVEDMNNPDHPQHKLPHAEDTLSPDYRVYKITIIDEFSQLPEDVLVQRPFFLGDSIFGRSTRGYIAYVLSSQKLRFLKDTWRIVREPLTPERALYAILEQADIPHVPRDVLGGDVTSDDNHGRTRCLAWSKTLELSTQCCNAEEELCHHRLLQDLAYPLKSALNSKEAVTAFRDCFEAIGAIRDRCRLLHRDISIGNVMIQGSGKDCGGVLLDWDHALALKPGEDASGSGGRTGTWQFLSIALLMEPDKAHDVMDDFESAFWSLYYATLLYFDCEFSEDRPFNMEMFNEMDTVPRRDGRPGFYHAGGYGKQRSLGILHCYTYFASEPLNVLIERMGAQFSSYHRARNDLSSRLLDEKMAEKRRNRPPVTVLREPGCEIIRRVPSQHKSASDEKEEEPTQALQEKFNSIRARLSDSSSWLEEFDDVLSQEGWVDDALGKNRFAPQPDSAAEKEGVSEFVNQIIFPGIEEDLVTRDPQAAARLRQEQVEAATKIAEHTLAGCIKWAIRAYDDDDDTESCDCVEDNDERVGATTKGISQRTLPVPSSRASTGTSARKTSAPSRRTAQRSNKAPLATQANASLPRRSGQKGGPSRLKRKIEEVAVASGGESSAPELPPRKKSKSQSRAGIAPAARKTKSASKKSIAKPRAAVKATTTTAEAKETKLTRARRVARKPQSDVEKVVTQPRREGLRPRPTKPTKR